MTEKSKPGDGAAEKIVLLSPSGPIEAQVVGDHLLVDSPPGECNYLRSWATGESPLAGVSELTVHQAMALVLFRAEHAHGGVDVYVRSDAPDDFLDREDVDFLLLPKDGRDLTAETLLADFRAYCALQKVSPRSPNARFLDDYSGTSLQNATYKISLADFLPYAAAYGLEVEPLTGRAPASSLHPVESEAARQDRRLERLNALGANRVLHNGAYKHDGVRGVLKQLIEEEKQRGASHTDEKTVTKDLDAAAARRDSLARDGVLARPLATPSWPAAQRTFVRDGRKR